mmetsp:Transcript_68860/g.165284  ORF Transcript_68860/g.165284 Transcript_68860/m.165284 type:complete len:351 (-) Transcript_68860:157-1209(-)
MMWPGPETPTRDEGASLDLAFACGPWAGCGVAAPPPRALLLRRGLQTPNQRFASTSAFFLLATAGLVGRGCRRFLRSCASRIPLPAAGTASLVSCDSEMALELQHKYYIFTDGSCSHEGRRFTDAAGFGAVVYANMGPVTKAEAEEMTWEELKAQMGAPLETLAGPVQTNARHSAFIGARKCTNNTAELSALAHALLWLHDRLLLTGGASNFSACIVLDSTYAKKAVTGENKVWANKELVGFAKFVLQKIRDAGTLVDIRNCGRDDNREADGVAGRGAAGELRCGAKYTNDPSSIFEEFKESIPTLPSEDVKQGVPRRRQRRGAPISKQHGTPQKRPRRERARQSRSSTS